MTLYYTSLFKDVYSSIELKLRHSTICTLYSSDKLIKVIIENQMYKVQYAFNLSMIMCSAIHMATRSLLRSSSTHEPSDPLSRVSISFENIFHYKITTFYFISDTHIVYIHDLICIKKCIFTLA